MATIETLYQSAKTLPVPDEKAAQEFEHLHLELAEALNKKIDTRPDLEKLVGKNNVEMMHNNARNMTRFLASLFHSFEPQVLADTVIWVFTAYRSHGFHVTYWAANLDNFSGLLKEKCTEHTLGQVLPVVNWMITNIPAFTLISDEKLKNPEYTPPPDH